MGAQAYSAQVQLSACSRWYFLFLASSQPLRAASVIAAMPHNSKIYAPFDDKEPPKSKYESRMTYLEFLKKAGLEKTIKRDNGAPPKHIYEHTVEIKWHQDGGAFGKETFAKKK